MPQTEEALMAEIKSPIVRDWRNSSHNGAETCFETRFREDGTVELRNNKRPDVPVIYGNRAEWAAFVTGIKNGEHEAV